MTNTTAAPLPFRRITNTAPMSEQTRANILPFYAKEPTSAQDEPEGLTACYERLSQDDRNEGESNSIVNQKKILERHCKEHGYTPFRHYDDDGVSGVIFDRPAFKEMMADIEAGIANCVIVKDANCKNGIKILM
ncbi:MAG: recombinase family protein [Clostridiales bacterium]|jgi:hypothetical protein|nr:recombinase family protein [Clostridiales bacterium]